MHLQESSSKAHESRRCSHLNLTESTLAQRIGGKILDRLSMDCKNDIETSLNRRIGWQRAALQLLRLRARSRVRVVVASAGDRSSTMQPCRPSGLASRHTCRLSNGRNIWVEALRLNHVGAHGHETPTRTRFSTMDRARSVPGRRA